MNNLITNYREAQRALKLVLSQIYTTITWRKLSQKIWFAKVSQKISHVRHNFRRQIRPLYLGIAVTALGVVPLTATPVIAISKNADIFLITEKAIVTELDNETAQYLALQSLQSINEDWQTGDSSDRQTLASLINGTTLKPYIIETFDTRAKEEAAREAAAKKAREAELAAARARRSYTAVRTSSFSAASAVVSSAPAGSRYLTPYNGYNRFSWGWCTWYVATRFHIPWGGNAGTWLSGARSAGYMTGSTPRANSIVVTRESGWGHVAVVEKVSGGMLHLAEMNYSGFGVISRRTLSVSSGVIKGYIY
ncbi:CHAP domain-containing protein [Patescibacteria group bacterium]